MPTYLGWNVVTMPSTPAAPQSMEGIAVDPVSVSTSPFTGAQQVQIWAPGWQEISVSMPPMKQSDAIAWVAFLVALKGVAGVFQFGSTFAAAYAETVPSGTYWRLKSNIRKWSVSQARTYGIQFECRLAF